MKRQQSRKWLRPASDAFNQSCVIWKVEEESYTRSKHIYGEFTMRDCNNSVTIDLYANNHRDLQKQIKTLRNLQESLQDVLNIYEDLAASDYDFSLGKDAKK